ncbi:MAG: hypothetical protein JKY43_10420 [Phycisphaerales bacterium]|nr:hypothetical protein [Phycisphaerales bacterium]
MKVSNLLIALAATGLSGVSYAHVASDTAHQAGIASVLTIHLGADLGVDLGTGLGTTININPMNFGAFNAGLTADMGIIEANPFSGLDESTEIDLANLHIAACTELSIYASAGPPK